MMKHQSQDEFLSSGDRTSVLVSEASKMYCDLLSMAFYAVRDRFYLVGAASNTTAILSVLQEHQPDVVIVSDHLEDAPLAGIGILPEIRRINPDTRILLVMGTPDRELVVEAFRFGANGVFCRNSPFDCCANRWMRSLKEKFGQPLRNFAMFSMNSRGPLAHWKWIRRWNVA